MKHNNDQLVILMAGKGTRLYPLTLGFPKCLLSIKQKPAIYNMLIPLIKDGLRDIIFVVNNENISIIKDFMNITFSNLDLNIQYVIQTDFLGPGKALSLVADTLNKNKSVIILLGDTLCEIPDKFDKNWIGTSKITNKEKSNYCIIEHEKNKITNIIDKPNFCVSSNEAAIGLYYFKNANVLSEILKKKVKKINDEYQLSSYFKLYQEKEKIYIQEIKGWEDIGTLEGYMNVNQNSFNCRFFNTLHLDSIGVLHKKSIYPKIASEINWFKEIKNTDFEKVSPKFYDSIQTDSGYGIEFYDYLTLSEYFTFYPLSDYSREYIFKNFINKILNLYNKNKTYNKDINKLFENILIDKTYNRITEWKRNDIIEKEILNINGKEYFGIFPLLKMLNESIINLCNESYKFVSIIHGDLAFSNILFSPRSQIFKFIDPRGNFGIDTIYGDYRYDIAKIRHCYHGKYDEIINDLFSINEYEKCNTYNIKIDFYKNSNINYLDSVLTDFGININDIELIEGLLFISMIPLHNDYPKRQLAFFARGIEILNNQLEIRGLNE